MVVSENGHQPAPHAEQILDAQDRQYQFLMNKIFGVVYPNGGGISRRIRNLSGLELLQSYSGQGRYESKDETGNFPVDQVTASIAEEKALSAILEQVRSSMRARGYRGGGERGEKGELKRALVDGKRTTNAFFETNLRDALNEISEQVDIPFLLDETVQGTVTLKLENTPLAEALDMLLVSGGFSYRERGQYILVGFPQSDSPTFKHLSRTELVHPVYLKPSAIASLLSDDYKNYIKTSDPNNSIVVTAPPAILQRIMEDIAVIDHKPAQIKLEALIADISTSGKQKLGFDWWSSSTQGQFFRNGVPIGFQSSPDSGFSVNILDQTSTNAQLANNLALLNLIGETDISIGDLSTSTTVLTPIRVFAAAFNAMSDSGEARVWATPSVVASDGRRAMIDVSSQQVIPIVSGPQSFLQVSTKEYTSGVILEIVPRISGDGEINLEIKKAEVGTISFTGERQSTGDQLPVLTKRKISTSVALKNRETLIIGGLLDIQHDESGKHYPGMEDSGFIGDTLLGTTKDARETRDLVIFITPTLLEEHAEQEKKETFL